MGYEARDYNNKRVKFKSTTTADGEVVHHNVDSMPPLSGSVTANLGSLNGAATEASLATLAKDGTEPTGVVAPTGATGLRGWLGAIWQALTSRLPTQIGGAGGLKVEIVSGGGTGGTASTVNAATPSVATAAGFSDGVNLQIARLFDADTGAGVQLLIGALLRQSANGGSVEVGTAANPMRTDPTAGTAQPVTDAGGSLTTDTPQLPTQLGNSGGLKTEVVGGNLSTGPIRLTYTDRSGTLTAGGTAQTMMNANNGRTALYIENRDAAEDLWIRFTGPASVGSTSSERLAPGDVWQENGGGVTTQAVSVVAATAGHPWHALEGS